MNEKDKVLNEKQLEISFLKRQVQTLQSHLMIVEADAKLLAESHIEMAANKTIEESDCSDEQSEPSIPSNDINSLMDSRRATIEPNRHNDDMRIYDTNPEIISSQGTSCR